MYGEHAWGSSFIVCVCTLCCAHSLCVHTQQHAILRRFCIHGFFTELTHTADTAERVENRHTSMCIIIVRTSTHSTSVQTTAVYLNFHLLLLYCTHSLLLCVLPISECSSRRLLAAISACRPRQKNTKKIG